MVPEWGPNLKVHMIPQVHTPTAQERITEIATKTNGSKVTLEIPEQKCWENFDSIVDVQEFVTRLAIKSGKQGTVQDLGHVIRIEWG